MKSNNDILIVITVKRGDLKYQYDYQYQPGDDGWPNEEFFKASGRGAAFTYAATKIWKGKRTVKNRRGIPTAFGI